MKRHQKYRLALPHLIGVGQGSDPNKNAFSDLIQSARLEAPRDVLLYLFDSITNCKLIPHALSWNCDSSILPVTQATLLPLGEQYCSLKHVPPSMMEYPSTRHYYWRNMLMQSMLFPVSRIPATESIDNRLYLDLVVIPSRDKEGLRLVEADAAYRSIMLIKAVDERSHTIVP